MHHSENLVLWLGGATGSYRCAYCGYVGALTVETDETERSRKNKARTEQSKTSLSISDLTWGLVG